MEWNQNAEDAEAEAGSLTGLSLNFFFQVNFKK